MGQGDEYEFLVASSQFDTQFDQSRIKLKGYVEEVNDGKIFLQYELTLQDTELQSRGLKDDTVEKKTTNTAQKLSVFLKPEEPQLILNDGKRNFTLTIQALD